MKGYLYCILTSGRLFELPYGEEKFTLSFARWLVKQNLEVIIIGSTFAGIKAKYLSKDEETENRKDNQKKIRAANLPYVIYMLSRLYLSLLYFFKILSINRKTPIRIIHAQDTGYSGLPAVIAGKILKIPVVLSSHIIRHRGLEPKIKGRIGKILLKCEYSIDIFTVRKADRIIAINPDIKSYGFEAARQRAEQLLAEQQRRFLVASTALWQGHEWLIRIDCGDLTKAR